MVYVQSSALARVSYDEATRTLYATFRESGRTYAYQNVPREIYNSLMVADSPGQLFQCLYSGPFSIPGTSERTRNRSARFSALSAAFSNSAALARNLPWNISREVSAA